MHRVLLRFTCALILALAQLSACAVDTNELWLSEMPPRIFEVLRSAIDTMPEPESLRVMRTLPDPKKTNTLQAIKARHRDALESLRQTRWPKLDGLERIRFPQIRGSTRDFRYAWLVERKQSRWLVIEDRFAMGLLETAAPDAEVIRFEDELKEVMSFVTSNDPNATNSWRGYDLKYWRSDGTQYFRSLFNYAYAAAWFGHEQDAVALMHAGLRRDVYGTVIVHIAQAVAARMYDQSMTLFDSDAARSEVLAAWERFVAVFPQSEYTPQLKEYSETLRQQLADFPKITASTIENPEKLEPAARAEYFLQRFPDERRSYSWTIDYEAKQLTGKVVKLGHAALPALIDHLSDRRLTRQTGGSSGRPRNILRVQDLALHCLEEITKLRFSERLHINTLSAAPEQDRQKLIADVRDWWAKNGSASPAEAQMAGLEKLPLHTRVSTLDRLEREHAGQIDSLALLRKWTNGLNSSELEWVAEPLAVRGDRSLIPLVRDVVARGLSGRDELLIRYGGPEDYAVARAVQWQRFGKGGLPTQLYISSEAMYALQYVRRNAAVTDTNLLVPLFVDALEYRQPTLVAATSGRRVDSQSDNAMQLLVKLTGYSAGYDRSAPVAQRFAAMDNWLAWWHQRGREEFVSAHPAAAPLMIDRILDADARELIELREPVHVFSADRSLPVGYEIARETALSLVRSRAVNAIGYGKAVVLRFASSRAEEEWFSQTAPKTLLPSSTKAQTAPVMRVEINGGVWPDSEGKIWTCLGHFWTWPASFDGKQWSRISENDVPLGADSYRSSFRGFNSAIRGERGAMIFFDIEYQMTIHASKTWSPAVKLASLDSLMKERLRNALPITPEFSDTINQSVARDADGNIWFRGQGREITVVTRNGSQQISWPEKPPGVRYTPHNSAVFAPLDKGRLMLTATHGGLGAIFSVRDGKITREREIAVPEALQRINPRRDEQGNVWLIGQTNSVAFDQKGKVVREVNGSVLALDNRDVWFRGKRTHNMETLCLARQGKPDLVMPLRALSSVTAARDETVWVLAENELLRVGLRKGELKILERWQRGFNNSLTTTWCDDSGRLWCSDISSSSSGQLICFPMRKKAAN